MGQNSVRRYQSNYKNNTGFIGIVKNKQAFIEPFYSKPYSYAVENALLLVIATGDSLYGKRVWIFSNPYRLRNFTG